MSDTPQTVIEGLVANTVATASNPKIVTLPNGNLLVAYATSIGGSEHFIRGQQFDAAGNRIGGEINFVFEQLFSRCSNEIEEPEFELLVQPDGRVVIIAETSDQFESPEGFADTQARTYELSDGGDVFAARIDRIVDIGIKRKTICPAIAGLGDGTCKIFFTSHCLGQDDPGVTSIDDAATGVDTITVLGGKGDADTDADTLSNGSIVALLDRASDKGFGAKVDFRIVRSDGSIAKTGKIDGGVRTGDPAIRALANGGFVVAWAELDRTAVRKSKQDTDVCFQMFDANGNPTTDPRRVGHITATGTDTALSITPLDDGGFTLFYDRNRDTQGILGQRFDSEGNPVGGRFVAFLGIGGQPDATALPDGRVAVAAMRGGNVEVRILGVEDPALRCTDDNDPLA